MEPGQTAQCATHGAQAQGAPFQPLALGQQGDGGQGNGHLQGRRGLGPAVVLVQLRLALFIPFLDLVLERLGLAFGYRQQGPGFYMSRESALACGLGITPALAGGIRLKYTNLSVPDKDVRQSCLSFDAGITAATGKKVSFAAMLKNPLSYSFPGRQVVPAELEAGILYHPDPCWAISLEMSKTMGCRPVLSLAAGLRPASFATAWIRFVSQPWQLEIGCGTALRRMAIYSRVGWHHVLGLSPGIDCKLFF